MPGLIKRNTDQVSGEKFKTHCICCETQTFHVPLESMQREESDGDVTAWTDYQIIQCRGCESIRFREVSRHSEDYDTDPETGELILAETVESFVTIPGRPPIDGVELLPKGVRRVYDETLSSFDKQLPILTAIGIRALVEAICKQRKAAGRNLETRINALVAQGVLTREGTTILHRIRLMGNAAAHEIRPPAHRAIGVALDVVEHTLMAVYILPRLARKELPKKRKR